MQQLQQNNRCWRTLLSIVDRISGPVLEVLTSVESGLFRSSLMLCAQLYRTVRCQQQRMPCLVVSEVKMGHDDQAAVQK